MKQEVFEAITALRNAAFLGTNEDREKMERAVEVVAEALSAEPCSDAISRQAALEMAVTVDNPNGPDDRMIYVEDIEDLPSVYAEQRTKRCVWCDSPYRIEYYWIDREGNTASYEDEGRRIVATGIAKYCPNCGARMEADHA